MFLTSLLLSVITLAPAMGPHPTFVREGMISAGAISPDKVCKPGDICASSTLKGMYNGCLFNNFWNSKSGGTPLTIDVTETGASGKKVYVYWVNATNTNITITGEAQAKYYCFSS